MKMLRFLTLVFVIHSTGGEVLLRLKGGKFFNEGILQILTETGWGDVCDSGRESWTNIEGAIVCRELGFPGLVTTNFGDTDIAQLHPQSKIATRSFDCPPASSIDDCRITLSSDCERRDVVSLRCTIQSKSACKENEEPALGSCYSVKKEARSFAEASRDCGQKGGSLVEINNAKENQMLGMILEAYKAGPQMLWTGGVVSQILDASFNIWHGSQRQIEFLNGLDTAGAGQIPMGVAYNWKINVDTSPPTWKTKNLETPLPYICESKQADVGCLSDDDPEGLQYSGPADRDSRGRPCIRWSAAGLEESNPASAWTHNFCRNPDEDYSPYCYVDDSGEPSMCAIPSCGQEAKSITIAEQFKCPKTAPKDVDICEAEEFLCGDGSCIYKGYVCDGEKDCPSGDDELNCRRFTSLYVREPGFQLKANEKSTIKASLEECARECFYRKPGLCTSFSHRPGKDGKADKCILGSDLTDIDCVSEKSSWNYYTLNSTEKVKRGVASPSVLQGLRIRKIKETRREILEVKVGGAGWGGVCDDGFTMKEADVICKQLGFNLGAQKVIPRAGRGSNVKVVLQGLKCQGNETSVTGCAMDSKVHDCDADQAVGIECREVEKVCEDDEFHCHSGECIHIDKLCDGITGKGECSDGSDELPLYCESQTQVRLTGGEDFSSGRLEVRHKGIWGTVCNDNFNQEEADVFCRMLGYEGKASWSEVSTLKQKPGSWPIWLQFPSQNPCSGNETSIEFCHDKDLWNHDYSCSHHEDVELTCTGDDVDFVPLEGNRRQLSKRIGGAPRATQVFENCGLRQKSDLGQRGFDVPRVAGGEAVGVGAIPWQASIRLRGPSNLTFHHCGAVIISPFHVLTTAHCLWDYRKKLDIYYVRVGDNVIEVEDVGEKEYDIEKVDFHPGFNVGPYLNNDIALAHLKKKSGGIRFNSNVGPVCLPPPDLNYIGLEVTISGWGKNSYDSDPQGRNYVSKLQAATVPVIPRSKCKQDTVYGEEKLSAGMFCAGLLEGGVDSCQGDSGGPAVIFTKLGGGNAKQQRRIGSREERGVLAGITSWGYGCGRENKPGVYTRVSKYVPWILQKVHEGEISA